MVLIRGNSWIQWLTKPTIYSCLEQVFPVHSIFSNQFFLYSTLASTLLQGTLKSGLSVVLSATSKKLALLHSCETGFLMSYEGADHAPYDVIDSVFPEQDSQQPPKDLVLNVCIFFSISAS